MKRVLFPLVSMFVFGLLIAGCGLDGENESVEGRATNESGEFYNEKVEKIELKDSDGIGIFTEAVNNANQWFGEVDMESPHYLFTLDEESYYLWIDTESGTIMNTKDTGTIFSLTGESVQKVYDYINDN